MDREELSYGEWTSLVDGLMNDHTSHTFASAAGYSYVPSPEEVFFWNRLDADLAMNRGRNQPAPPRLKRPWEQARIEPSKPADESEIQKLKERLGITD